MEDVITEAAPPSRFLEEDLNIFAHPSPPLPSPFFIFPHNHSSQQQPLKPSLLIIALSPSSLALFHTLKTQTPIASLILPELPLSTPHRNTADIFSLSPSSALLAAFPSAVSPHRAHRLAQLLLRQIRPASVLVLDSLSPNNFRTGRLSSDETVAFKLETSAERKAPQNEKMLAELDYYPSGSVVDGLGAAILARCQVLNLRAGLCATWPQFDAGVVALLKGLLQRRVLLGFEFASCDEVLKFGRSKDRVLHSELYI